MHPLPRLAFLALLTLALAAVPLPAQQPGGLRAEVDRASKLRADKKFTEALPEFQRLLPIAERDLGKEDALVGLILHEIAFCHTSSGQSEKAEPLYVRALAIREAKLGKDHVATSVTLGNLAILYLKAKQYAKAEPLFLRLLKYREANPATEKNRVFGVLFDLAATYQGLKQNDKAEFFYKQALADQEGRLGKDHIELARTLNTLAYLHRGKSDYAKAEPLHARALAIVEAKLGADHRETGLNLINVGGLERLLGRNAKAEPVLRRAVANLEKADGPDHLFTAQACNFLGHALRALDKYKPAEEFYQRALRHLEAKHGPNHQETAYTLQNLATVERALGRNESSEKRCERALAILEAKYGGDSVETGFALQHLAVARKATGKTALAEAHYNRSLGIMIAKRGKDHTDTANVMLDLARIYRDTARYDKAETMFIGVLDIREAKRGKDHGETADTLTELANLYREMGRYTRVEAYYQRALAIRWEKSGPKSPETAFVLQSLGLFYLALGNYPRAELAFDKALAIREEVQGKDNLGTAGVLELKSRVCRATRRLPEAEKLLERALSIQEAKLGKDHPTVAITLNSLSGVYKESGRKKEAVDMQQRALEIYVARNGKDHPHTATIMGNLAGMCIANGEMDKAEKLSAACLEIHRTKLGPDHPSTSASRTRLAGLAAGAGRSADAVAGFDQALRAMRRHTGESLTILSENEQLLFLQQSFVPNLKRGLALVLAGELHDAERSIAASWLLNGKNVGAESLADRALKSRDAGTAESHKDIAELQEVRRQLAAATVNVDSVVDSADVAALKARERNLIKALAKVGGSDKGDPWFEIAELRKRLPGDAAFLDIGRFNGFDFKEAKVNAPRYAAFISFRDAPTQIVDLGPAKDIDDAIQACRSKLEGASDAIRAKGEIEAERNLRESLAVLAKLVLAPLRKHVDAKEQWIVCPDSNLWLVPWAILPLDEVKYAVEDHRIHYVVSGRDLRDPLTKVNRATSAPLVLADPDFDLGLENAPVLMADLNRSLSKDFKLGGVRRLPGTAVEAEAITPFLAKFGGAPRVFTNQRASTTVFRAAKSPRIVVLSTHGYFLEGDKTGGKEGGPVSENPLLRCGLLLAGCNNANKVKPGQDNGVLTGLEIVGTDLRGTEMVVLSACETGLGVIGNNGDGVAGLRQAFQLAGAASVVATLWQVPDVQSAQLMVGFFGNLSQGQRRDEALRNAQLDQIRNRRAKNGAAHPFFWAAYTVTGQLK